MAEPSGVGVELREIDADNVRDVMRLSVRADQENSVAPNSWSIAEAAYTDDRWLQAVYADDEPVGLVLVSERPGRYYLWRFMIDGDEQGKGYGAAAMGLVLDRVRSRPDATEIFLSFVPGDAGPEGFYRAFGFEPTGREHDGELEMRLLLQ